VPEYTVKYLKRDDTVKYLKRDDVVKYEP
jgi:hypothetical protein